MNGDQPPIDDDIEDQIYAFVLGILSEDEAARLLVSCRPRRNCADASTKLRL